MVVHGDLVTAVGRQFIGLHGAIRHVNSPSKALHLGQQILVPAIVYIKASEPLGN
jgi:hypothetical protein